MANYITDIKIPNGSTYKTYTQANISFIYTNGTISSFDNNCIVKVHIKNSGYYTGMLKNSVCYYITYYSGSAIYLPGPSPLQNRDGCTRGFIIPNTRTFYLSTDATYTIDFDSSLFSSVTRQKGVLYLPQSIRTDPAIDSDEYSYTTFTFKDYGMTADIFTSGCIVFCLLGDTLITMADRSKKRIDEIVPGDMVLSYDFNTQSFFANKVISSTARSPVKSDYYVVSKFDDGTVIKTTKGHRFYSVDNACSRNIENWDIGTRAFSSMRTTPKLISREVLHEDVLGYDIEMEQNTSNYFANGILCGNNNSCSGKVLLDGGR